MYRAPSFSDLLPGVFDKESRSRAKRDLQRAFQLESESCAMRSSWQRICKEGSVRCSDAPLRSIPDLRAGPTNILLEREEMICSRRGRRMKIAPYRQRISTGSPRARADGFLGAAFRRAEANTAAPDQLALVLLYQDYLVPSVGGFATGTVRSQKAKCRGIRPFPMLVGGRAHSSPIGRCRLYRQCARCPADVTTSRGCHRRVDHRCPKVQRDRHLLDA
jgi:hypothetical protein